MFLLFRKKCEPNGYMVANKLFFYLCDNTPCTRMMISHHLCIRCMGCSGNEKGNVLLRWLIQMGQTGNNNLICHVSSKYGCEVDILSTS